MEKLWLTDVEKMLKICLFVLTWSTNVTDRWTDRQTDNAWRHRPRLCIASCGNKTANINVKNCSLYTSWLRLTHLKLQKLFSSTLTFKPKLHYPDLLHSMLCSKSVAGSDRNWFAVQQIRFWQDQALICCTAHKQLICSTANRCLVLQDPDLLYSMLYSKSG